MNYSQKLRDPRWQKKRLEILQRDNFTCTLCDDKETTLHIHHLEYVGDPWECPDTLLQTVCEDCHLVIEWRKNEGIKNSISCLIKATKREDSTTSIMLTSDGKVLESYYVNNSVIETIPFINIAGIKLFLKKIESNG